ncbi:hypothetical protein FraEuI1c_5847 [Pseudofrankia inefficax]|uniref:Uncharacterized protein n=1 Tax=Pseudofrankia inefficax (strain DSM 45817 / CECT 9037 / DDB 130130 / EuI1c) TaxID=298654 RepID=E3IX59_PSEI1|nr:hypothetical protein FraEuI1c_5847 [Pseudofrankia inefficax]
MTNSDVPPSRVFPDARGWPGCPRSARGGWPGGEADTAGRGRGGHSGSGCPRHQAAARPRPASKGSSERPATWGCRVCGTWSGRGPGRASLRRSRSSDEAPSVRGHGGGQGGAEALAVGGCTRRRTHDGARVSARRSGLGTGGQRHPDPGREVPAHNQGQHQVPLRPRGSASRPGRYGQNTTTSWPPSRADHEARPVGDLWRAPVRIRTGWPPSRQPSRGGPCAGRNRPRCRPRSPDAGLRPATPFRPIAEKRTV